MAYRITARSRDQKWELVSTFAGLTLLEELQQAQVPIKSSCMGKGTCHQCRVKVERGVAPISASDRKTFSEEQLQAGWRLSCYLRPKMQIEVSFPQVFVFHDEVQVTRTPHGEWWLACDLGTTGVEVAGVDANGVWGVVKALNRQVSMGADVMTRLEYAQRNGVSLLTARCQKQLSSLIAHLQAHTRREPQQMWVAGNSAVTAFLTNDPIDQLAVSPYQPRTTGSHQLKLGELNVTTLPLLYSFVGGDLFAGLFLLWSQKKIGAEPWILMDVGTNSEILFWDGQTLFVSSTPAGPAFEGSSISIGMRAEAGAILNPRYIEKEWVFRTVNDDVPKGICGTGLIEMISQLVEHGFVKIDGEVVDEKSLALTADLSLNQDDVREFQLAKSAIATGLQLVQAHGLQKPQKLYLAGSFGENLPLESCQRLGLLPRMPTETLGNSSLRGTILWGQAKESARQEFETWLHQHMKAIELALSDDFQSAFVENMTLESPQETP